MFVRPLPSRSLTKYTQPSLAYMGQLSWPAKFVRSVNFLVATSMTVTSLLFEPR